MAKKFKFSELKKQILKRDLMVLFIDCAQGKVFIDLIPGKFEYIDDTSFELESLQAEVSNSTYVELQSESLLISHPEMNGSDLKDFMAIETAFPMLFPMLEKSPFLDTVVLVKEARRLNKKCSYYEMGKDYVDYCWNTNEDGDDCWSSDEKKPSRQDIKAMKAQKALEEKQEAIRRAEEAEKARKEKILEVSKHVLSIVGGRK